MEKDEPVKVEKVWQLQGAPWASLALLDDQMWISYYHLKTLSAFEKSSKKKFTLHPTKSISLLQVSALRFKTTGKILRIKTTTGQLPSSWRSFSFNTEEEMLEAGHLISKKARLSGAKHLAPISRYIILYCSIILLTILFFYLLETVVSLNWITSLRPRGGRLRMAISAILLVLSKWYKLPYVNLLLCFFVVGGLILDFVRSTRSRVTEWRYTRPKQAP